MPTASEAAAADGEGQGSSMQPGTDTGETDEGTARFVDGPIEDRVGDLPALGSITFTVDAAHQASGEFAPGGNGLELSLTDAAGLTWTLTLPAGALSTTETITMTALDNVRSDNIPGSMMGGVLLEPDGLQLIEPGTLAVAGGGLDGKALFLGGNHDGADVNFALPKMTGTGSEAVILHFSSYTVIHAEDPQITELRQQEMGHYKELAKKGRELLKNKNIDVPRPPSIPLHCPEDEDEAEERTKDLKKFEEEFRKPEAVLLDQLMASQTSMAQPGVEPDFTLEVRLLERMIKKVNLLIKQYGNQAENVSAITQVGYTVAREIAFIGPTHPGSIEVIQSLGRMSERVIDELLKELREEHEYRNIGPILEMSRRAALTGVGTIPLEDLMARIESAMNFNLEVTYELKIAGNQIYEFKGETPVQYDYENTGNLSMHGLGIGELVSYKNTAEPSITLSAPNFNFEVLVSQFDPCNKTANLTIDRFAPFRETYKINEELMPTLPLVHNCWTATYEKYAGSHPTVGEVYTFPLELRSGDPVAVEDEIEETAPKSQGQVVGVFKIKLTHAPK